MRTTTRTHDTINPRDLEPVVEVMPDPAAVDQPATGQDARDMTELLATWPCDEGQADGSAARLIRTASGEVELQVRVELGMLQMRAVGRPDGVPTEKTALARLRQSLAAHRRGCNRHESFGIGESDAAELDCEGRLYAKRYLAWFGMGRWNRVARDARHHLAAIEFAQSHASPTSPSLLSLRRWLPYAVMMLARAESAKATAEGDVRTALKLINSAQRRIKRHFRRLGDGRIAYTESSEVAALKQVTRRLREQVPESMRRKLKRQLNKAVASEDFERAATLRDRLALHEQQASVAQPRRV